jgi:hypothetical protein
MQIAGGKIVKAQIVANYCCNASGMDKLPHMYIGTNVKPWYFATNRVYISQLLLV